MLRIWYGADRARIWQEVKRLFGDDYEVHEGAGLDRVDLVQIGRGVGLIAGPKKILIKDLAGAGAEVFQGVMEITDTTHEIVVWEEKLDKRTAVYKKLVEAKVEMKEWKLVDMEAEKARKLAFEVLETAMRDGKKAVEMVEKMEMQQDPYMFFGLMVSQALKKYSARQGVREKKLLAELAELDMQMKSAALPSWMLVKAFLLRTEKF